MTSTPASAPGRGRQGLVAVLAVLALLAGGFGVTSAVAAVARPSVQAVPSSPTALRVAWTGQSGATGYRVQYATNAAFTAGVKTVPAAGQPALTGTSTTLTGLKVNTTYHVRVATVDPKGGASAYGAAGTGVPRYPYAAPGDLVRTKVTRSGMRVAWTGLKGAPGYTLRAYAKDHPTKYFTTAGPAVDLTGLVAGTTYYLSVAVEKPGTTVALSPSSPEAVTTTSTYALASPDGFAEAWQSSASVGVRWTPVAGAPADAAYRVSYALDAAQTVGARTTGLLHGTSGTIGGLAPDTTYYATITLVDKTGRKLSRASDFVVAKSRVPRGTLSGAVTGVSGSDLTAAAYDAAGNVAKAVTVGSDGRYDLGVRPGVYRVQLMYTGTGGYASAWALSGRAGAAIIGSASPIQVVEGKTTTVPKVTIAKGHTVSGTVLDRAGRPVRDVDVTAISGSTAAREVLTMTASAANGRFTLRGLPTGTYWLRFAYSGDGFQTLSQPVTVKGDTGVRATLADAAFRSRYKAYIQGTRRVGSTVNVWATPWLAGSYPTTRATMSYQWKRNGVAVPKATGTTYRLTSADRGKAITVTVTARRYGYATGTATSNPAKIS